MKSKFSNKWKSSNQPRKQIKFKANAPAHIKQKLIRAPLSKELKTKYEVRTFGIRVGDKVKVLRGQNKGKEGKVEKTSLTTSKIQISGIESIKKDGSKTMYPIHASNIMIIELYLDGKKRKSKLEVKKNDKKSS